MRAKKSFLEVLITAIITTVISGAVMLLQAQFIVWGLSMFQIDSGIWPVWLLGSGFEGILALGVAAGIRTVRND